MFTGSVLSPLCERGTAAGAVHTDRQTDRGRCLNDQRLESVEALFIPQTHIDDVTGEVWEIRNYPPPTYSLPGRDKPVMLGYGVGYLYQAFHCICTRGVVSTLTPQTPFSCV